MNNGKRKFVLSNEHKGKGFASLLFSKKKLMFNKNVMYQVKTLQHL